MEIKFNHEEEDLVKIVKEAVITDNDSGLSEEEIINTVGVFSQLIQGVDLGFLVHYLNLKFETEIKKVSELTEIIINDIGFKKFKIITHNLDEIAKNNLPDGVNLEPDLENEEEIAKIEEQ